MRMVASICAVVVLAFSGCGEDPAQPQPPIEPPESAFDRQVRENCEIVAAAAEAFHQDNGEYPWYMRAFEPYLPDGKLLVNPATA